MSHTTYKHESVMTRCACKAQETISFLDTSCQIIEEKIILDLYKKPTDRNMYLLPSSCHPQHIHENAPFSLALRIVRNCTLPETRDQRLEELRDMLLNRNYRPGMVKAAIEKARNIPRDIALRKVVKQPHSKIPVCVVSWDPRLPSIDSIQQKHYRAMTSLDPYLKEVYPQAPIVAYKRPKNIREYLIRAKLPPPNPTRPSRQSKGMKKCKKNCLICPYIEETKEIKGDNFSWKIETNVSCNTNNIVYMLQCKKERCQIGKTKPTQYIGETERNLRDRVCEHIGYINTQKLNQPAVEHFNLPGHSKADMKVTILERVIKRESDYRKERESYLI